MHSRGAPQLKPVLDNQVGKVHLHWGNQYTPDAMSIRLRRKRYAAIVVALLTLIFVGAGAVISMMTRTTFRPLPFVEPNQLVQYVEIEDGDPEPWESDSLAQTTRLVPEITGSAMHMSAMPMSLTFGPLEKPARVIVTSPNFLRGLVLHLD